MFIVKSIGPKIKEPKTIFLKLGGLNVDLNVHTGVKYFIYILINCMIYTHLYPHIFE
jgi:hypothetical protein